MSRSIQILFLAETESRNLLVKYIICLSMRLVTISKPFSLTVLKEFILTEGDFDLGWFEFNIDVQVSDECFQIVMK